MLQRPRTSNSDLLTQYLSGPAKKPSNLDVAKYILLNADTSKSPSSGSGDSGGNEPSLMSRIFDILSRPNYAVAEAARTGSPMGILAGLSGRKKTTFSDVLDEYGVENRKVKALGGLALDIGLDPTTYIPGASIAKGISKVKGLTNVGKSAARAIEIRGDKTLAQKLLSNGREPINPENFGLPAIDNPEIPLPLRRPEKETGTPFTAKPTLDPRIANKASDVMPGQLELPLEGVPQNIHPTTFANDVAEIIPEVANSHVKGQIPFRYPKFSVNAERAKSAHEIVEGVAKGNPEDVAKVTPKPRPTPDKRDLDDANSIIGKFDPTKSTARVNKENPNTLNAKQQVKLYYLARDAARARFKKPNAPANAAKINHIATKVYIQVEKIMEEGHNLIPRIGTGEDVRLSDVLHEIGDPNLTHSILKEFGSEAKSGSQLWQVLEHIRARNAVHDAPVVKQTVDKAVESVSQTKASNLVSDAQQAQIEKVIGKLVGATTKASGASPATAKSAESLVSEALNAGKSAATIAVEQKSKILDGVVARGVSSPEVNHAVTRGLESDLGSIPRWAVTDNKAVEFLMGRVATWWGQRDLRPLSLNAIGSSASTARARGAALDRLFHPFNPAQRYEALKLAQGIGAATSEETYQLATQIKRMMDNLVGQMSGKSVVMRAGLNIDMINRWMSRYKVGFEFTKGKVSSKLGGVVDYSKGSDWVNSWKTFDPSEDPKVFLFKMQEAIEQATREKALYDEIGERFGTRVAGKGFRSRMKDHPYLDGYYFTDDIAKQLPRVIKDWSTGPWNTTNPLIRHYDRVLSMWKAGVTIYRPGHHIRNIIGDVYLGWMDGVNSVRPYVLAARVQRVLKDSYPDLMDVDELVKLGVMGRQYGTPMPGEVIFKNKSGVEFTANQIAAVAHQKGLLEHARTLEDIIDLGEGSKFKPFGGRVQSVARSASELQSHNARLAHFIDKVMKSNGANLERIFEDASRRARKWHPTGLDLTDFEKKVMRRIIPFYSWMRKSMPLLIEGLVMNPGKVVATSKINEAIQTYQGIETPSREDPFPVDQMFPSWILAQGFGPISKGDGFLGKFSDQSPPGYVMAGMGVNPLNEMMAQVSSPGKTILSGLTPGIGIPLELLTGRKSFTGEPITGPDARPGAFEQYVGENIPIYSAVQGITGITPFGTETRRAGKSDQAGKEAFVNWLTGLGVRGTGPYIKQAYYEKQAPLNAARKADSEKFLSELRKQIGEG